MGTVLSRIIDYCNSHSVITAEQAAKDLNIPEQQVRNCLSKLKKNGYLKGNNYVPLLNIPPDLTMKELS